MASDAETGLDAAVLERIATLRDLGHLVEKYASACVALDHAMDYGSVYAQQEAHGIKALERKRAVHAEISTILGAVLALAPIPKPPHVPAPRRGLAAPTIPAPVKRTVPQEVLDAETNDPHAQLTPDRWNDLVTAEFRQLAQNDRRATRAEGYEACVRNVAHALRYRPNEPATLQALACLAAACYDIARFGDDRERRPFTYNQYRDYPRTPPA